jgi:hypothetical protein
VVQLGGDLSLGKGAVVELKTISVEQPALLRALEFSAPREQAVEFGRARLRVTWDGRAQASIDAPVALFFGAGTLYNRDGREFLVRRSDAHPLRCGARASLHVIFRCRFFVGRRSS